MPTFLFTVSIPGEPRPKGRPRFVRRSDGTVTTHTPKRTVTWEGIAATLARQAWRGLPPITVAVEVQILAVFRRLADTPVRAPERRWRPHRPDVDNVLKAALDALTKAQVLRDDALAVRVVGEAVYAGLGEQPHVVIRVLPIGEVPTRTTA